ncbi:MAG: HNH endonuclease [Planctomycetota bacterium]|nr:HNH endonuclease [Planctomycetaceae bacterium]MDQ3331026.1 HNH endonuclease [Planctomycetota bacterium]
MPHFTGPRGQMDPLRSGENTQSHAVNLVLNDIPQSVSQIVTAVKKHGKKAILRHLSRLKKEGFAEKIGGDWKLTPHGLSLMKVWRQHHAAAEVGVFQMPLPIDDDDADDFESNGDEDFRPDGTDHRERVTKQIHERRGQRSFRQKLRKKYDDRCMVTGCRIPSILEAAHIQPYRGEKDNHPQNGVLLRADIHTLFDLDLLGIRPKDLGIELNSCIASEYQEVVHPTLLCGKRRFRPSPDALRVRYELFCQRRDQ